MDIDTMEAGSELDALVAEKVMEWNGTHDVQYVDLDTWYSWCKNCGKLGEDGEIGHWEPGMDQPKGCAVPPRYSTDITAAWEVVEKMPRLELIKYPGGHFFAGTGYADEDGWEFEAEAPTAPLAICRAALKAVGLYYTKSREQGEAVPNSYFDDLPKRATPLGPDDTTGGDGYD
jgi:hypothetical protein